MKSVGIDIGTDSIKVAEIDYQNRKYIFSKFSEYPLDLKPGTDTSIDIIENVRKVIRQYERESTKFVLAIGQEKVTFRFKSFPFRERQKIYKSLPFELEDETPFTVEDAIFESKIIRYHGLGADVIAFACPKSVVEETLNFAKDIGVSVSTLSTDSAAITNLIDKWWEPPVMTGLSLQSHLEVNDDEDEDPAKKDKDKDDDDDSVGVEKHKIQVILHIGHRKTILIAKDELGSVSFNTIMWGYHDVLLKLVEEYEIPYSQAHSEYTRKAFLLLSRTGVSRDQQRFSDILAEEFENLIRPMRRVLLEWRSEFDCDFDQILTTGTGAHVENLGAYLTMRLEIPTNPFKYQTHLQQMDVTLTPEQISAAPVAIGLAIEGHKRPRNPAVDFLKDEFAIKSEFLTQLWSKWGSTVRYAVAVFLIFCMYAIVKDYVATDASDSAYTNMLNQGKAMTGAKATPAKIRKYIREENKITKAHSKLSKLISMNSGMDVLKSLSDAFPPRNDFQVEIKRFDLQYDKLVIEGTLESESNLPSVTKYLKKIAKNQKVKTETPTIESEKPVFAYSFFVDRGIGKAN